MKNCPFCNAEIADNANFCIYCMASLIERKVIVSKKTTLSRRLIHSVAVFVMLIIFSVGSFYILSKIPLNPPDIITESEGYSSDDNSQTSSGSTFLPILFNKNTASNTPDTSPDTSHDTQHSSSSEDESTPSNNSSSEDSTQSPSETSSTFIDDSSSIISSSSSPSSSPSSDTSKNNAQNNAVPIYLKYEERTSYPSGIVITDCAENTSGTINIPKTINGKNVTVIKEAAFAHCKNVTSITLPSTVKIIEGSAFYNCTSLSSINLPGSLTSIGTYAFYGCKSLKSVTIPSGLRGIQFGTFEHCTALSSIRIPSSIVGISDAAFWGCNKLTTVYYGSDQTKRETISIGEQNDYFKNANWKYNAY